MKTRKTYSVWQSIANNEWYITLFGANGEPLAHSEGHHNKEDARQVVERYFSDWKEIEGEGGE